MCEISKWPDGGVVVLVVAVVVVVVDGIQVSAQRETRPSLSP